MSDPKTLNKEGEFIRSLRHSAKVLREGITDNRSDAADNLDRAAVALAAAAGDIVALESRNHKDSLIIASRNAKATCETKKRLRLEKELRDERAVSAKLAAALQKAHRTLRKGGYDMTEIDEALAACK